MQRKKIYVSAYTCFNVGDDLFLITLCKRFPEHDFYILAHKDYQNILKNVTNMHIINSASKIQAYLNKGMSMLHVKWFTLRNIIRKCDAIVYLGGSIFIENSDWKNRFEFELKNINKPKFVIGSNFGPYKDNRFYEAFKDLFGVFNDVCFREEYSYQLFKDLSNVRKAPDVVFNYDISNYVVKERTAVGICVINTENRKGIDVYQHIYEDKLLEACEHFASSGIHVKLMSFCRYENDEEAITRIYDRLSDKGKEYTIKVMYKTDLAYILKHIGECKMMIATRFHAMILGWLAKCNVIPIMYSGKMLNVIQDCNFNSDYYDIKDIDKLTPQILDKIYNQKLAFEIQSYIDQAPMQFEGLANYLRNS